MNIQASSDEMMWLMKVASVISFACCGLKFDFLSTVCALTLWKTFHISRKQVPSSSDSDETETSTAKLFVEMELITSLERVWASSAFFAVNRI